MKSIKEILSLSEKYLKDKNILGARFSSELLISHILRCKRLELYMNIDKPLLEEEIEEMRLLLKRRGSGEPLDYILGFSEFQGCRIEVSRDVLIPRPETEELVSLVQKNLGKEEGVLWDVCTGSGCIAIALKKKFFNLKVFASDISLPALEIAKKNAFKNDVCIEFLNGDLLEPFSGKADFIVCNPPYVSEEEFEGISFEVRGFEPKIALVAKEKGVEFYQRLAGELPKYLKKQGKVFFEIGQSQAGLLNEIFSDKIWISKKVYKDSLKKDRFFFLEIE